MDQGATTAKVNVATGSKIGHAANVLRYENLLSYDNLVLHIGQNNIDSREQVNTVQYEIAQLGSFVGAVKVIKVPESQVALTSDGTEKMLGSTSEKS